MSKRRRRRQAMGRQKQAERMIVYGNSNRWNLMKVVNLKELEKGFECEYFDAENKAVQQIKSSQITYICNSIGIQF